jgi:hypothetical protein
MTKILFLLKERLYSHAKTSYGLINSATHVADYLEHKGYCCKIVQVLDANSIDKEVYNSKPDIVILEALWCPVYKLKELMELRRYRHITWVIRVHSDIGYLSAELQGMRLLNEYRELHKKKLIISMNSKKCVDALSTATGYDYTYLPNIITRREPVIDFLEERRHIDIGCFGAMRLLKNQCFQAICSMIAADQLDKKLFFHITPNLGVEKDAVLENLKELFKNSHHELVIHDWMPNQEFQKLVRRMDIGLQLSFTESFNIVSADFINNDRVILVSDAIDWLPNIFRTSTTDYNEVVKKVIYMYKHRNSTWLKGIARLYLAVYNGTSQREWMAFLRNLNHSTPHHREE